MTLVVDASVAVKWLIDEPGSDAAAALAGEAMHAPSLIAIEVGNTLRTLAARGDLDPALAGDAFALFLAAPVVLHEASPADLADALDLALRLDHPIYDCVYLALAARLNCRLITADRRFQRAAAVGGFDLVVLLEAGH